MKVNEPKLWSYFINIEHSYPSFCLLVLMCRPTCSFVCPEYHVSSIHRLLYLVDRNFSLRALLVYCYKMTKRKPLLVPSSSFSKLCMRIFTQSQHQPLFFLLIPPGPQRTHCHGCETVLLLIKKL